jgi:serine/threonine-protein kinase RsbW
MTAGPSLHEVTLTIPPKAEFLTLCRLALAGMARIHAIDEESLADLKLAVTEACSNSIRHAYRDGLDGAVSIRFELAADRFTVEVEDDGSGFDPALVGAHSGELDEEGMGIAIIRELVDEFELGSKDSGGSRLRFTKLLGDS